MTSFGCAHGQNMDDWSDNIRNLMDEMSKRKFVHFSDTGVWQPAANLYETSDAYVVCVDLAGMDVDQIEIAASDVPLLVIAGTRNKPHPEACESELSIHVMEIDEGPFRRELELPGQVDPCNFRTQLNRGFLWIFLPKKTN